jgi:cytochrome bd ubiquinol oxidase subunit II
MVELWFGFVALTLAIYAVLDGWNIGAGILHFIVARTPAERRQVVDALTPVWSWHEVWLVAAGGTLFVAFPSVLGVTLSGFYLAVFVLLWSLIWRGMSLEVGGHLDDPMWRSFWDCGFAAASTLLAILLGAALGNLVRGVPLDASGRFSLPFFTNFTTRGNVGILDWYTLSVAGFTFACVAAHGASYLTLKTEGAVHDRSERLARRLWPLVFLLLVVLTTETALVRPALFADMGHRPLAWFGIALYAGGAGAIVFGQRRGNERQAFLGGCSVIVGLLEAGAASVFPVMLHSTLAPGFSLTAHAGAVERHGLWVALAWWPAAFLLAFLYFAYVMRHYREKVRAQSTESR